jgi:hypothetical protein
MAARTVADVLDRVADRLARGWCQRAMARTRRGRIASPHSWFACQWCLWGAIVRETRTRADLTVAAERWVDRHIGMFGITTWNDDPIRTHIEVVAACRAAAQAAREAGA